MWQNKYYLSSVTACRETNNCSSVKCVDENNLLKDQFLNLTKIHLKQLEIEAKVIEQRWDQLSEQPQ